VAEESASAGSAQPFQVREIRERSFFARVFDSRTNKAETAVENLIAERGPIHTYHLGLWFGSPSAAQAAGCPNTVTRFNGEHRAGIQALSTRNFGKLNGLLRRLTP
jgi:hypothetical protein